MNRGNKKYESKLMTRKSTNINIGTLKKLKIKTALCLD